MSANPVKAANDNDPDEKRRIPAIEAIEKKYSPGLIAMLKKNREEFVKRQDERDGHDKGRSPYGNSL